MEDLHSIWHHRWITHKAHVQKSSIHGLGIVATKPIRKGEVVFIWGGVIVPSSDMDEYRKGMGHIGMQIHEDFWICPTQKSEIKDIGTLNHSCNPNVGFEGSIIGVAITNIKVGEELTVDYAFMESDFRPFKCNCKSDNCRKIIKPSDWKIKKLQKKYKNYFSSYLKRKITED